MNHSWKVVGASVQGTLHIKTGIPCQDAHCFKVLPENRLIIAVADGAGSAENSASGAAIAVQAAVSALEQSLVGMTSPGTQECQIALTEAVELARLAVLDAARSQNDSPRSYATTLTLVLALGDSLFSAQIGDGVAVVETGEGDFRLLTTPQRGEYANETYFITGDDALSMLDFQVWQQSYRSLIVMTDGLIRLAFHLPEMTPHSRFFRPFVRYTRNASQEYKGNEDIASFLASAKVGERTQDDKSMVIAVNSDEMA